MKAIWAWYLISLTWKTRTMYAMLADMNAARFAHGTNPLRTLVDGLLFVVIGVLLAILPIVGLVLFPLTSLWFVLMQREDYQQTRDLVRDGRMHWRSGTWSDPPKPEPEPQPEVQEAQDGQ